MSAIGTLMRPAFAWKWSSELSLLEELSDEFVIAAPPASLVPHQVLFFGKIGHSVLLVIYLCEMITCSIPIGG